MAAQSHSHPPLRQQPQQPVRAGEPQQGAPVPALTPRPALLPREARPRPLQPRPPLHQPQLNLRRQQRHPAPHARPNPHRRAGPESPQVRQHPFQSAGSAGAKRVMVLSTHKKSKF